MGIRAPGCWRLDTSGIHTQYIPVQYVSVVILQCLLACGPVAVGLWMTICGRGFTRDCKQKQKLLEENENSAEWDVRYKSISHWYSIELRVYGVHPRKVRSIEISMDVGPILICSTFDK